RLSWPRVLGVLAGFAGVAVMMGGARGEGTLLAQAACLGAALCYALAGVWGRRFRGLGLAPLSAAFGQVCCAALVLTPLVMLVDQPWSLPAPGIEVLLALAGMAVLSTAFAYGLYFRLLDSAGAVNASLVT